MEHRQYDHVERLDHPAVEGLLIGAVHVFPKIDGANASIWRNAAGDILCGSRTRLLRDEAALQGFRAWVEANMGMLQHVFNSIPETWRLYGEWLVPHTLKTYREDAWRQFYVFDVFDHATGKYVHFDSYYNELFDRGLRVVEPMVIILNPSVDQLYDQVKANTYLIKDNAGLGEGIVAKNFHWVNDYGRQPWGKIVRTEFKEENRRAFGVNEKSGEFQVESAIAEEFVTGHFVSKARAKIENAILDEDGVSVSDVEKASQALAIKRHRVIPRLLQTVYTDLLIEESYHFVKKHSDPVIDFKKLRRFVTAAVKKNALDLF